MDKGVVGYNLTGEYMDKLWYTTDLLGWDNRETLVWHHRLKHCTFNTPIRLSKRVIIPKKLTKVRKTPLTWLDYFVSPKIGHAG